MAIDSVRQIVSVAVRDVVEELEGLLGGAGVGAPRVDVEWMVRHVTGWSRAQLTLRSEQALTGEQIAALQGMGHRRARREPLQLILGSVGFRYLELEVRQGVFIPRPETEVLAGQAIARVPPGGIVVEPCTGTGAVACAVAAEAEPAVVVATDVSAAAVELARRNGARYGATVTVHRGDLLAPVDMGLRGRVDVLVANPPYVAAHELAGLPPEVIDWDPRNALVAGPTGHEVSDRLIAMAGDWLTPGGWLLLEIAEHRAADVAARATTGGLADVSIIPDLAGRDRVVAARRARAAR